MAEAALKKLEDQLNCPVCLDTYTTPSNFSATMFIASSALGDWWIATSRDNSS